MERGHTVFQIRCSLQVCFNINFRFRHHIESTGVGSVHESVWDESYQRESQGYHQSRRRFLQNSSSGRRQIYCCSAEGIANVCPWPMTQRFFSQSSFRPESPPSTLPPPPQSVLKASVVKPLKLSIHKREILSNAFHPTVPKGPERSLRRRSLHGQ